MLERWGLWRVGRTGVALFWTGGSPGVSCAWIQVLAYKGWENTDEALIFLAILEHLATAKGCWVPRGFPRAA